MRIIFLTQYFPPETGAPQNRLFAMAKALQGHGAQVTVLTAMPNYPDMRIHAGYRGKFHVREQLDGLDVHRAWLYVSQSRGLVARLFNYFSFVFTALLVGAFKLRKADVLLVESPPLFLGITAMLLARLKGAKLVFNVSDLWPESAVQLGLVTNKAMIRVSTWLEERCYRRSALVTGQTKGIVRNISGRFPEKKVLWVPNGVDLEAIAAVDDVAPSDIRDRLGISPGDLVLAYTGILGHAQGLHVVLEAASLLKERKDIHFILMGDGPEKEKLIALKKQLDPVQVHFVDRMPRKELLGMMRAVDAAVVPLLRNDLFLGAIPSKIFEALVLAKPIVLGVDGEARELFINEGRAGLFFEPEDAKALAQAAVQYADDRPLLAAHGANGARYVREHFDRKAISDALWNALQELK
ncbi:MAG TPA: glycosyltransferase family 4 protein [Flavobacteriales bacterium]|nr:glycosyltransferase family 4 protein [Flavobacteriales bacterium]